MRIRFPDRPRSLITMAGLAGLITLLTPVWLVDRLIARLRTARCADRSRSLPRVTLGSGGADVLAELMDAGKPVIITDLYAHLDLTTTPDLPGLRGLGDSVTSSFPVNRHRADAPYFLYVGDYGSVRDHTVHMTLHEFLDDMFGDDSDTASADICTYKLFAIAALDGAIGSIIREMATQLEEMTGRRADTNASGIWVGSTGVTTPLHHDAWTGLLFQPVGSKRVAMYGPVDRDNVYFTSPFRPTERWSGLPARSHEADPAAFPRLAHATRFEGELLEGETLFIPPYWSHEVEALEPNISIPFRFATRAVDYVNPGFLRPAVEVFHRKYLTPTG